MMNQRMDGSRQTLPISTETSAPSDVAAVASKLLRAMSGGRFRFLANPSASRSRSRSADRIRPSAEVTLGWSAASFAGSRDIELTTGVGVVAADMLSGSAGFTWDVF